MRIGNARRRLIAASAAAALACVAVPAHASEGYRYWSFWTVTDDAWGYAQLGPASTVARDGDVHGWRFGISTDDGALAPAPRTNAAPAFTEICAGTPQVAGSARVALLIDFGTKETAPTVEAPPAARWSCVVVPEQSTGATVLSQVAQVRLDNGFVCGIDGFPASECSVPADIPLDQPGEAIDVIADARSADIATESGDALPSLNMEQPTSGDPLPIIIGGVVIVLGLLLTWALQSRQRQRT
jgi:hypothetical protein